MKKMSEDLGLIRTIDSDDEKNDKDESSDEEIKAKTVPVKKKDRVNKKHEDFNEDFEFDLNDETSEKHQKKVSKKARKIEDGNEDKGDNDHPDKLASDDELDEKLALSDVVKAKNKKIKSKKKHGKEDGDVKKDETISYSEVVTLFEMGDSFQEMEISRPIMKALNALSWEKPTPIQSAVIPKVLMGHDICACAATGTGKTGAFMIPIIERLIHKPNKSPITRVLVLTPTRELAIQNYQVSRQLAQFTNIQMSLSAGGTDRNAQEAALRLGPDVVIATLGRLIDHLQNAPSFNLDNIEILVLDEADRMLDEFFAEQMKEVIARCSRTRQTLLFSATMTEKVEDLATVSLNKPVKVFVNENIDVAMNLQQEFIRIRPHREDDREAIVAALVKRFFQDECILFVQTKKEAHRIRLVLNLLHVKAGELHGNLTQPQRLEALQRFKDGGLDVLIATDLVARGLDIAGVKTVINMTMPPSIERYIHRVGRTARAGKSGTSVTLVGENERQMLTKIAKRASYPIKLRTVPKEVISEFKEKIGQLKKEIKELDRSEKAEKEMRIAELQLSKAKKVLDHGPDPISRPKRKWFQSNQERNQEKDNLKKLAKGEINKKDEPSSKRKRSKLR